MSYVRKYIGPLSYYVEWGNYYNISFEIIKNNKINVTVYTSIGKVNIPYSSWEEIEKDWGV